ncbi:MAG: dihydrolipoyl dehydrogenase [Armatimonadota bacterium]
MASESSYDVGIIGGGPGGYVAAVRAAQLGLRPVVVEKEKVGGVCLHHGCIPSKALLRSAELMEFAHVGGQFGVNAEGVTFDMGQAMAHKEAVVKRLHKGTEGLLRHNKVDLIAGHGALAGPKTIRVTGAEAHPDQTLACEHIIIATGSRPRSIPGLEIDGEVVITSDEGLELEAVPASIAVVGGGYVGVEFAYMLACLGSQVTIIELLPAVVPLQDEMVSTEIERALRRRGVKALTDARVEGLDHRPGGARVTVTNSDGSADELDVEKVLVAVGRDPITEDLGLEDAGVEVGKQGVTVHEKMQTTVPNIYAIGDVVGRLPLAHVASAEGILVAETIAGNDVPELEYQKIPSCVYCQPEVGAVGLTEKQAREAGHDVRIGQFRFLANGKALALGEREGMVKVLADAKHGEILGVHIVGPHATELIVECGLAMTLEATDRELGTTVHPHPTLSEAIMEAARSAGGWAIHGA